MRTDSGMDVTAAEILGHVGAQPFSAMFVYDKSEPMALSIVFPTGVGGTTWVLGRDLVIEAIQTGQKAGIGDVQVDVISPTEISFQFANGSMSATTHFALHQVMAFINLTLQFVPQGQENIDAEIDAFLAELNDL